MPKNKLWSLTVNFLPWWGQTAVSTSVVGNPTTLDYPDHPQGAPSSFPPGGTRDRREMGNMEVSTAPNDTSTPSPHLLPVVQEPRRHVDPRPTNQGPGPSSIDPGVARWSPRIAGYVKNCPTGPFRDRRLAGPTANHWGLTLIDKFIH